MTLDITIGKVTTTEDGEPWVRWTPEEPQRDDGTDPDLSISHGKPWRSVGWGGVPEWLTAAPEVHAIFNAMGWDGTNDRRVARLDESMMSLVAAVSTEKGKPIQRDRAALNATAAAPDLTALREAVEAWRFICNRYDRDLEGYGEVQRAEHDVLIAADILFPEKGGTP